MQILLILGLIVFFFGCASVSAPWLIQKGQVESGYLVTMVVANQAEVEKLCDPGLGITRRPTAACAKSRVTPEGLRLAAFVMLREAPRYVYDTMAHEFCHIMENVNGIFPAMACHQEDHGMRE